jgi:SAM like domain present in kinase suppressor RAS 1
LQHITNKSNFCAKEKGYFSFSFFSLSAKKKAQKKKDFFFRKMADEGLDVIQSIREVIDISADHLERLRTQCATSVLTQQETRTLESKLVRMFCELLSKRQNISDALDIPMNNEDLLQWLRVVGLSQLTINAVIQHVNTLETLLKLNDDDICAILTSNQAIQTEETRRLVCAINNLKRYQQCLKAGTEPSDMFWDSWDRRNNIRLGSSPKITSIRKCRLSYHLINLFFCC